MSHRSMLRNALAVCLMLANLGAQAQSASAPAAGMVAMVGQQWLRQQSLEPTQSKSP